MGVPEVEVSPVYFAKGLALGQCGVPEGSQCHQRGTEEKGMEGDENRHKCSGGTVGSSQLTASIHLSLGGSAVLGHESTLFHICARTT